MKPYYQDNAVTIYHGDCREILPHLEPVDLVLTDPPYGINHKHSGIANGKWNKANSDTVYGDAQMFEPIQILIAPAILFGADHYASRLPDGGIFHVWDKECGRSGRYDSFSDAEIFWTSWQCKRRVIRYLWKGLQVEHPNLDQIRQHPTQKPLAVMAECIGMSGATVILDPFMGSGTTLRAAKDLGRKAIGIEIEEKYCEIAAKRMAQEVLDFAVCQE